jgi:5-formyltetrahydrofolate cyclo-ligase
VRSDRLWFAPWTPESRFRLNRFGIPEPMVSARQLVRAQDLDLLLLPLVGFDARGHRLGMGGGFYDRSLAFLRHRRQWHKPVVVGLAHDFQCCPSLPADAWDIPMSGIVTDRQWYSVPPG